MTPEDPTPFTFTISTRCAARVLALIIGFLTLAGLAGAVARHRLGMNTGHHPLIEMFNLDREQNAPTYYQGIALFITAAVLACIAVHKWKAADRFRFAWAALSILFLMLSMDEICSLHEQVLRMIRRTGFRTSGLFFYEWVIPGLGFVLVVGCSFVPFIWHFPKPLRNRVLLSAVVFVSGALGMEMVSGRYVDLHGPGNLTTAVLNIIEECLEMTGIAIFLVTLLRYMSEYLQAVIVRVTAPASNAAVRSDSRTASADTYPRHGRHASS